MHAILLMLISAGLAVAGARFGGAGLVLLWPAVSFAIVAGAYLARRPGVFAKTPGGSIRWYAIVPLGPFLLYVWVFWNLARVLSREPAWNRVADGLYIGRRAYRSELPEGLTAMVDLTAEMAEPADVRSLEGYRCLPVLDGTAPPDEDLARLVGEVAAERGAVLVHCAQGHGRSALVVAAILLARGLAATPQAAVDAVRQCRPGVGLRKSQLDALARFSARR